MKYEKRESMLVRKNILKVKPYVGGKPIEEVRRELGLKEVIKLASNENPLGASRKAQEAIKKAASEVNRYPDSQNFYLKDAVSRSLGLTPADLIFGNGSDELIDIIIKTFVEEDENIITSDTTFLEYEIIAQVNGRAVKKVPLKNFKYDLESIRKQIDKKTKLIFIANPNNPTGTYVNRTEVGRLIDDLPKDVILVIDEAYGAFIDVKDFPDGLKYIKNNNVIIMRTFSKAFGLAGLRVGYAAANPLIISYMERARQPFNVNLMAQRAVIAAIGDKEFLVKTRKVVLDGKRYLYSALKTLGVDYVPSVSNFILIDVRQDGVGVFKKMLKLGIIVRDMEQYGLKNFIRVTIGMPRENKRFIEVLRRVL